MTAYTPPLPLLISVLSCTDRHPLLEEGAGMSHVPADTDLIHDPRDDCSERRRVTDLEREALDLLGQPTTAAWERHSISEWARVDRLAGVLAELRRPFVPVPRPAADWRLLDVRGGATR